MVEALERYYRAIANKQVGDMQEVNLVIAEYQDKYGDLEEIDPAVVNEMCDRIEKI